MSLTRSVLSDNVVLLSAVRASKERDRADQVATTAAVHLRRLRALASALTFAEFARSAKAEGLDNVAGAYRTAATKISEIYLTQARIPELAELAATLAVTASRLEKENAS